MKNLIAVSDRKVASIFEGVIYVIGFDNGIVKVGKTRDPDTRLGTHKSSLGMMSKITGTWVSEVHKNYHSNERLLINKLDNGVHEIGMFSFEDMVSFAKSLGFENHSSEEIKALKDEKDLRLIKAADHVYHTFHESKYVDDDSHKFNMTWYEMCDDPSLGVVDEYLMMLSIVLKKECIYFFTEFSGIDDVLDLMESQELTDLVRIQISNTALITAGLSFEERKLQLTNQHNKRLIAEHMRLSA